MLFKVTQDKDFFQDNPGAKAIPEFIKCNSREMKYISLVYDYKSPLKQLRVESRKDRAISLAGYPDSYSGTTKLKGNEILKVSRAIRAYLDLQYDSDMETLNSYDDQMDQYRLFLRKRDKSDSEMKLSVVIMEKLIDLEIRRKELINILEIRDQSVEDELEEDLTQDKGKISMLDEVNMGS